MTSFPVSARTWSRRLPGRAHRGPVPSLNRPTSPGTVLYINDIVSIFDDRSGVCKLFADDVKLYTVLQTEADYYSLQCKLNQLFEWS